jgi:adenylate kinase family enzyme
MTGTETWLAVIGPPAVGKASLAEALAQPLSARVFPWRVLARARNIPQLPHVVDPRGEYADHSVDELLRDAFLHGGFPASGRAIILPDFPVTTTQLMLLHSVARTRGVELRLLELDAINAVLMARAHHRRLCLACRPDPGGEPHDVAPTDPQIPSSCPTCGGPLALRSADEPATFFARLSRYREERPGLWSAARAARIPWVQIMTRRSPRRVLAAARRLLAVPSADVLLSDDGGPADGLPRPRHGSDTGDDPASGRSR